MEGRSQTFEVLHVVLAVVDISDERQCCNESCSCCTSMLYTGDEDKTSVEALPVVPEDACYSDGLTGTDRARHEAMVVIHVHEPLFIIAIVGTG